MNCLHCQRKLEPPKTGWKYNPFAMLCGCQAIIYFELAQVNPIAFEAKYCVKPSGSKVFPVH